jgi:hypothetical protein
MVVGAANALADVNVDDTSLPRQQKLMSNSGVNRNS